MTKEQSFISADHSDLDWRKTSSRIRRHVHLEPGQVRSADCLGTIAQSRMARDQREAVGGFLEVLGLGLGAAAHCGVGTGFRAGTASESIRGAARKNRAPYLSHGAGRVGAAKGIVNVLLGTERRDIPPLGSQPSLSRQIRYLEDDIGTQLPKSLHAGSDSELGGELFQ